MTRRASSKRRHPFAIAIGVLAGLATVAVAASAMRPNAAPDVANGRTLPQSQGICGASDGLTLAISDAVKSSSYEVLVPTDVADVGSLTAVHDCPGNELILEFGSGAKVYLDNNTIKDPGAAWEKMASDSLDTSVGSILGEPAALIDPVKAEANGSVTFVKNGTWVVVEGNGELSLDDLERIASSLKPYSEAQ